MPIKKFPKDQGWKKPEFVMIVFVASFRQINYGF